jgi:choline dehydrogenase-like flavoprotein
MDKERIANGAVELKPLSEEAARGWRRWIKYNLVCSEDIVRDFIRNFYDLTCNMEAYGGGFLSMETEQVPNPDSRVFLSDDTDRFGLRRIALDWRITDIERRTTKSVVVATGAYLAAQKYGNVKLSEWLLDDSQPVPAVVKGDQWGGAGYHHMGTTRMARTPAEGVVDENCRVFGIGNLFIAGSSVFSTVGRSNPTLTIVQLTLRLGDHLERTLKA